MINKITITDWDRYCKETDKSIYFSHGRLKGILSE